MFGLETGELLLILIILLLLFGARKLPELSRSVGESIRELRKGFTENTDTKKDASDPSKIKKG